MKKQLHQFSKGIGLKITIEGPLERTDFLNTILDLRARTYATYSKPNSSKMYVHTSSNHPPAIKKEITRSIEKRLSSRSSSEQEFKKAIPEYEKALKDSGFKEPNLTYHSATDKKNKKKRTRNYMWYNPPFCETVATNMQKIY